MPPDYPRRVTRTRHHPRRSAAQAAAGEAFSDAENAPENDAFSATAIAGGASPYTAGPTPQALPVFCVRKRRGKCAIFRPGANVPQKARMPPLTDCRAAPSNRMRFPRQISPLKTS